jgi:hypothetical protein
MKRLKTTLSNLTTAKTLSREELKKVMGGVEGDTDGKCVCSFYCDGQFRGTNYGTPADCFARAQEPYWCPSGSTSVSYNNCSGSVILEN